MIGSGPVDLDTAKSAVSDAFNLDSAVIVLRRSHIENVFILFVADEATVSFLIHAGPTPGPGELCLICRCWTRHAFAVGANLPTLVDVAFEGIPTHAWEMGKAEALLSPYGWPQILHPETRNRDDYSMFRVSAWCFNPSEVPQSRDLHIVEPPVGEILAPPGKSTLMYSVSIKVGEVLHPSSSEEEGFISDESGGGGHRRQRQRHDQSVGVQEGGPAAAGATGCVSSQDWMGPPASGACQEACSVKREGSPSLESDIKPPQIDDQILKTTEAAHEVSPVHEVVSPVSKERTAVVVAVHEEPSPGSKEGEAATIMAPALEESAAFPEMVREEVQAARSALVPGELLGFGPPLGGPACYYFPSDKCLHGSVGQTSSFCGFPTLMSFEAPSAIELDLSGCVAAVPSCPATPCCEAVRSPPGLISPATEWRPANEVLPEPATVDQGVDVRFKGHIYVRHPRAQK